MNNEVRNPTADALLRKKMKKHLTTIINQDLWDKLVEYQTKYNDDSNTVGKVSVNSLIETSIKQFLARQGETV
jgi:uncharacterized protein (UPF0218 family)